jgi:hypothetical protein
MALFNLGFNFNAGADADAPKGDDGSVVILQYNAASVTVPSSEIDGRTVEQLFDDYADELDGADTSGATFMRAGRVVDPDAAVKPGIVYRACVTSDTKGA